MHFAKNAIIITLASFLSLAMAGEIKPFSQAGFDALTTAGKPVVLDISATWCPTCKAQKPILDGLMQQPAYKDVTLMTIDFDADKALSEIDEPTARTGDIFKLGKHRLMCGDSTDAIAVEKLMDGQKADIAVQTRHTTSATPAAPKTR